MEYVKTDASPEQLAHVLTTGGLEVEEVEEWTSEDGEATDRVLITSVTSNRGDLLSMIGVARHAAALLDAPLELPDFARSATDEPLRAETDLTEGDTRVQLVDVEGCPRYSALRITGVEVGPSPPWLAHRLEAAGIRPISNVVDATNYVVWEVGQPLHAFDHRLLVEGHIIVRRAEQGERMMTIDGEWRHLMAEDLVICDPKGPVAIAGIMGGADTQMRELTRDVLLESAHFAPTLIRRSAQRIPLITEASYRFERYVDPNLTLPALGRAAELILETAGGEVVGPALDVCARDFEPWQVTMRPERCNAVLGTDLSAQEMAALLERLRCWSGWAWRSRWARR
jgi:phenylalanyl-tRNA synthetase beta chain